MDNRESTMSSDNASANIPTSSNQPRRKNLSIEQKVDVIRRLESGDSHQKIADAFGVGRSTVTGIAKNKEDILKHHNILEAKPSKRKRKHYSNVEESLLEQILYDWFLQNRAAGVPISGCLLQEKALNISRSLLDDQQFKASNGWLHKFKTRFGIRQISIQEETLSANTEGSAAFCDKFREFIRTEGFDLDNIYNADETGLQWKQLPRKTLASVKDKNASGFKSAKDRVTVMTCANATGKHRIPLLVIGKSKQPRCFKGIDLLPVAYASQRNSWMDTNIFLMWYRTIFLPSIKRKMVRGNEKFLLILDNAPTHPKAEELNLIDPCCTVMYLPPNVNSLIQPMDQGVIVALKRHYRRMYLQDLLLFDADEQKYAKFSKSWNLLHCVQTVSTAWERVTSSCLCNSWYKLLGGNIEFEEPLNNDDINYLVNRAMEVPISENETIAWLQSDMNDPGWEVQTISQITAANCDAPQPITNEEKSEEEDSDEDQPGNESCVYENEPPSIPGAYKAASYMYDWMMTRCDFEHSELVAMAKLRDAVASMYVKEKLEL